MGNTQKTNYWALLLITIIAAGTTCFITSKNSINNPDFSTPLNIQKDINDNMNLVIFQGDSFTAKYLPNLTYIEKASDGLSIIWNKKSLLLSKQESRYINFYIGVTNNKNANPQKLLVNDWFDKLGPETQRQAPQPFDSKSITVNGIPAYSVSYHGREFQYDFYDVVDVYISHGTDIYEIEGFALPSEPSPDLTPNDIKAVQEYEKIFNQVLQSFQFETN